MSRGLILLTLALAAVLLGGCYASDTLLLDPDSAAHPLADGRYVRDGDSKDAYRVTLSGDGWYQVDRVYSNGTLGESRRMLFTAQGATAGHPTFAVAIETADGFAYASLVVDQGRVFLATPDCGDPLDRNLAVDHGGASADDADMTPTCAFHNRVSLLAAMTAFAGQADFGRPYQRH